MGRVFRPTYTVPLKPTHTIVTRDGARFAVVKGRECPIAVGRDGSDRVQVESENYAIEYVDANGTQRREGAGRSASAARQLLAKRERTADRIRSGLELPGDETAGEPLGALLAEHLDEMRQRNLAARHVQLAEDRIEAALRGCRWVLFRDVTAISFLRWANKLSCSSSTKNGYLRYVRGFTRWVADRLTVADPLRKVPTWNEDGDERRSTYALSDSEFAQLLVAAIQPRRRRANTLHGEARACLYLVAAYTGLRCSELAALNRRSFHLDERPPRVVLAGKFTKNGEAAVQPVPATVAQRLAAWLTTAPKTGPLWPGEWHTRGAKMLRIDLERAGLPTEDAEGRSLNFHGLRRRYATTLLDAGVPIKEAAKLMRHSDINLTAKLYAQTKGIEELGDLVERLPKVG